ncbi:mirror-image polydactyly gene 1 protein isoform X2 [Dunckerocampus dactyliophorus]|uniref:mirror-image polydactyly gene 1 protein isoform X2 n=1 Tax=Dunckerocampus dactyliophorus TaxID=161453 RepID=UPI002406CEEE|nr:mirror-image polydactyly gene 1 protein isoform X2 [Dunckerocampus dactyliophorus]
MYRDNPQVNQELRQRLPSPGQQKLSPAHRSSPEPAEQPAVLQVLPHSPCSSCSPLLSHSGAVCAVSCKTSGGVRDMEADLSPSTHSPLWPETWDGSGQSAVSAGPSPSGHVISHQDATIGCTAASDQATPQDRDKKVALLLRELDALRDTNKKLLDQLSLKEEELQRREVELRVERKEAKAWERPSELLDQLLCAHKDRDQALMSRVLLANQERDEALHHVSQLQQAARCDFDTRTLEDCDLEVEELLQRVCDSASVQEVTQFGSALVERVRQATQRRHDITSQEMKAVMDERDRSLAKCRRLEQEVMQERQQRASKDKLIKLQGERDAAVVDKKRLEGEHVLQVNPSALQLVKSPPPVPADGPQQAPPLLAQLQQLAKDKQSLEAELVRCQEAEREASERVCRLERLVDVLRKKVGTGSLRAVV